MTHRRLSQRVVVPVMFVSTLFLVIVDGAITTVALPSIGRQFHLVPAALDSVVVVYPVCVAMAVPASAWLGDRLGGKRLLLGAMALFTVCSALCGAADSLGLLVVFRAMQGLAGGLLTPVAGTLLFRTFSPRERVRASRIMIIPQQVAPALAPILGGALVDGLSWRWVFYVNLPLGLLAIAFGLAFLTPHRPDPAERVAGARFDLPGLLLSAAGLAGLTYGICSGASRGWTSPGILTALIGGTVLLVATVAVELRTAEPLLRLRLFQNRLFRDFSLITLVGQVPFMGAMFLGPLFIQNALGRSALDSGTSTFTEAIGVLLTVQLVSGLYARIGPRLIIGCGLLGVAAVLALFATCDAGTGLWTFRLYMFLLGVAMGGVFMPTAVAAISTVAKADIGQAQTLSAVTRQTTMALSPALVTTLLVSGGGTDGGPAGTPAMAAYQRTYAVLALLCLAAALYAFTLRDGAARHAVRAESDAGPVPEGERPADGPQATPARSSPASARARPPA